MKFWKVTKKDTGSFIGFCSQDGKEKWEGMHCLYDYSSATQEEAEEWSQEQAYLLQKKTEETADLGGLKVDLASGSPVKAANRERE
jgi:hypothetical protein